MCRKHAYRRNLNWTNGLSDGSRGVQRLCYLVFHRIIERADQTIHATAKGNISHLSFRGSKSKYKMKFLRFFFFPQVSFCWRSRGFWRPLKWQRKPPSWTVKNLMWYSVQLTCSGEEDTLNPYRHIFFL